MTDGPTHRIRIFNDPLKTDIVDEYFIATDLEAEQKLGTSWNSHVANLPNRGMKGALYRTGERMPYQTIS